MNVIDNIHHETECYFRFYANGFYYDNDVHYTL
jgi:hypothetical protein